MGGLEPPLTLINLDEYTVDYLSDLGIIFFPSSDALPTELHKSFVF